MTGIALLLGGGRFVGRRLLVHLLCEGFQVDVLNRGLTTAPHDLPSGARHLCADRTDPEAVRRAVTGRRYDAVFDTSGYRPREVEAVLAAVDACHYVFVSSVVVYAAMWSGAAQVGPLTENDLTVPPYDGDGDVGTYYAGYKRACELALLRQDRVPVTLLRPCGIYGFYDYWYRHDYFFDRIVRDRPILVPDSHLDRLVHLTSVDGLADLAHRAAAAPRSHRVLNVADRSAATCGALAQLCAVAAGASPHVQVYPAGLPARLAPEAGPRARFPFGAEPGFSVSCARAGDELGWQATDLAQGTARLFANYQDRCAQGTVAAPDLGLDDLILRTGSRHAQVENERAGSPAGDSGAVR